YNELGQLYYNHEFIAAGFDDYTIAPSLRRRADVRDFGVYLQDSWKATAGLTINVGLRWDGENTQNYRGQTVLNLKDSWQPRIGVIWDPWNNGATKIYASVGRFSYALPTAQTAAVFGSFVRAQTYNFDPVSVVQDPNVLKHEDAIFSGGPFGDPVDGNIRAPYQDELIVGVERLLKSSLSVGLKGT